jgi:5-methylcytosine-specific restriction endonuclease McrA
MSVSARIIRTLVAAGKDVEDIITVATAMERGDDAYRVFTMVRELEDQRASDAVIGVAVLGLAKHIIRDLEAERSYLEYTPPVRDAYRARRNLPESRWRALRQEVFQRDGYLCQYCGETRDLTCDHIMPLIRGGSNELDNLTTACRPCNSSKGDKTLVEWVRACR